MSKENNYRIEDVVYIHEDIKNVSKYEGELYMDNIGRPYYFKGQSPKYEAYLAPVSKKDKGENK